MDYFAFTDKDKIQAIFNRLRELEGAHYVLTLQHAELEALIAKNGVTNQLSEQMTNTKQGLADYEARAEALRAFIVVATSADVPDEGPKVEDADTDDDHAESQEGDDR